MALEMISIIVLFYFGMNRLLKRMDEGYWFDCQKPARPKSTYNKSKSK